MNYIMNQMSYQIVIDWSNWMIYGVWNTACFSETLKSWPRKRIFLLHRTFFYLHRCLLLFKITFFFTVQLFPAPPSLPSHSSSSHFFSLLSPRGFPPLPSRPPHSLGCQVSLELGLFFPTEARPDSPLLYMCQGPWTSLCMLPCCWLSVWEITGVWISWDCWLVFR